MIIDVTACPVHFATFENLRHPDQTSNPTTDEEVDDFEQTSESEDQSVDVQIDKHRVPRGKVQWGTEHFVHDWTLVTGRFRHFSAVGCDHWNLVLREGHTTLKESQYRYEYGFANRLLCP